MNCYNHPPQTAVAQCQDCAKGLCSQCATIYSMPICGSCNKSRINNERRSIIKELLVIFIGGLILTYFLSTLFSTPVGESGHTVRFDTFTYIMLFYICAGTLSGWQTLTSITPSVFLVLPIIGWLIYFAIKLFLAFWIGLVMLPIRIVRNIIRLTQLQKIAV